MGFFVIIVLWVYMLGVFFFSGFLTKRVHRKPIRIWVRLGLCTIFAVVPFSEIIASNIAFSALCEKQAGVHLVEAPEPSIGIFVKDPDGCNANCINYLLSGAVPFVETEVTRGLDNMLVSETGLYRFYLSSPDDEDCLIFLNKMNSGLYRYKDLFGEIEQCLAFKRIESSEARLSSSSQRGVEKSGFFKFETWDQQVLQDETTLISYRRTILKYSGFTTEFLYPFQVRNCSPKLFKAWWVQQMLSDYGNGKT